MNNVQYIKDNANIKVILKHLDITSKNHGDSFRAPCPIHGGDNPNGFDINAITGNWYCHTQCKKGGDIIELVQQLTDSGFYQACEIIASISGFAIDGITFTKEEISLYEEAKRWFSAFKKVYKFKDYDMSYQEMYPVEKFRTLTKELLEEYGVFYSREFILNTNITKSRIGFPIIFKGQLVGVDLRATKLGDQIKWLRQPKGLSCGHLLYNYDKVIEDDLNYVILVEGIMDCLPLVQQGYSTVCTFGASITEQQKQLIENMGVDVYIAYDGDKAGYIGVNKTYNMLRNTCNVYYIEIPKDDDPGSIDGEVFDKLFVEAKILRKEINIEI